MFELRNSVVRTVITGTPGTGKTTVLKALRGRGYDTKQISDLYESSSLGEFKDGEIVVDTDALSKLDPSEEVIEGHLSHHIDADLCVVLRCKPEVLRKRLESRDYPEEKIRDNLESEALDVVLSEALDVVLSEALDSQDRILELDTTDASVNETADRIESAMDSDEEEYGELDYSGYFEKLY